MLRYETITFNIIFFQMTYTTVRFGFYEIATSKLLEGRDGKAFVSIMKDQVKI